MSHSDADLTARLNAELVKVAARRLDPSGVGDAARLQGIESGSADKTLDRRRGGVVVGGVEEHRLPWSAVCACGERVRGERAERLHVVRAGRQQGGNHGGGRLSFGQCAEWLTAVVEADRSETGFDLEASYQLEA